MPSTPSPRSPTPPHTPGNEWRVSLADRDELATRRVARVAAAQDGVLSTRDLLAAGLSRAAISRWLAAGRLVRIHRGVYAYGHAALTPNGRRLAAVLACGPGAVLSHRSAAAAWGLLTTHRPRFDVITAGAAGRALDGIDAHRCRLHPSERTMLGALPITTVARTIVDLAAVESQARLERAIVAAERAALLDLREIDAIVARAPRRRGTRRLRAALAAYRPEHAWTRSELERATLALIERHGLPRPSVNALVAGHEVDLHWPGDALVVELDTLGTHGGAAAFHGDRARDQDLTAAGQRVIRLTDRQVADEPARVAATLRALLRPRPRAARRTPGPGSPRRRTRGPSRPGGRTPAA
ncbi:MAG TPA: type IV toxin-antitoxin system AbiEi family antitoxin domain-containing protein [Capillimicrobium sp.]|nr:type IV toxin-antitoxin system AbiEi family antitoxin domain-containing protein [Capillimicrobium sp.]